MLLAEGVWIDAFFYCPSSENRHPDRKPNPAMLFRAGERYAIDMKRSVMIGDKESDIEAGRRAGVGTLILFDGIRFIRQAKNG